MSTRTRGHTQWASPSPSSIASISNALLQRKNRNSAGVTRNDPVVPSIVDDVLSSPSHPLDASTHTLMKSRFGHDFSQVRVHNDARAAESARAVNAAAYTVGRDVVFGAGQYAAGTDAGRLLVAHELTHVIQQGSARTSAPLKLAHPHDVCETQADAMALHVTAGGQAPEPSRLNGAAHSIIPGGTIQRSMLGGILGGLGGALGGAVAGGLLGGPIGAVIGGVAGLIGGAWLGDTASTKSRPLTGSEIKYAQDVFATSVDYSAITITRDSVFSAGAPKTIGNTIHLKSDWGHFKGDTLELTQTGMETLIHEMGHVWQYQNGGLAYIPESLLAQFKAVLSGQSRDAAYDWRAAHAAQQPWEQWNPEQQAEAIQDYNILLRKSKDGTATVAELSELSVLLPYMNNVWRRQGAPHFEPPPREGSPI